MESVAIVTGITIFFAVLLFLGGPEYLRWQAVRNRNRYQLLLPALDALGGKLRATAGRLRHYRSLEAKIYQQSYSAARAPMEKAVAAFRAAQQQQEQLRLPEVGDEGLAIRHFFQHPEYLAAIPRDLLRLGRLERYLTDARRTLEQVNEGLTTLAQVPTQLQKRAKTLSANRLQPLANNLSAEQEAGVAALDQWLARHEALTDDAQSLVEQLRAASNEALPELDTLAQMLDRLEESADALETEIAELVNERRVVDEQLQRAQATQERMVAADAPALAPLLARSERLLEAAANARREAAFTQAGEYVAQARTLLTLANDLAEVAEKVTMLETIAGVSLEAAEITELVEAQQRAHTMIRDRLAAEAETADERTLALSDGTKQVVERLQRQVQEMDARAQRLQSAHEANVRELSDEAAQQQQALAQAWQRLVKILPAVSEDTLADHYHQLQQQRMAAAEKPTSLRAYVNSARGMSARLNDTAAYLEENLQWAGGLRQEIADLLAAAESAAADWHALQAPVTTIKESAAAIWQLDPLEAETLAEAYDALDELQAHQERALDAWETLNAGRQRLTAVEQRIARTEAALDTEAIDPGEWERVEQLVQGFYTDARRAETVEAAVLALQEVNNVLRDLAG